MHQHTGYIPSRRKKGDSILYPTSSVPPPVSKVDLSTFPVLYQKQTPSCVAHAVTMYVMWLNYRKTGQTKLLSPRFLYALTIKAMGTNPSGGSSLDVALATAKKYGICEDSYFTNNTTLDVVSYCDTTKITPDAYANALNYRVNNYHFLAGLDEDSLKQAMALYGLVLYGMDISDAWWTNNAGNGSWLARDILPIRPPKGMTDPTLSRHLILGTGYDQTPFDFFRNSFGSGWGDNGNGYFATNDLPYLYEAAVIESLQDAPAPIQPKVKQAVQIVDTVQQLQSVETPQNASIIQNLIQQLWAKLSALFK